MITHANRAAESAAEATFLLDSLKKAHAHLLSAIEELAKLTGGPVPDKAQLVATRWNVSDASLIRRLLWGRIHAHFARYRDPDVEHDLRTLQNVDIRLIRMSAKHVARWTADAILEDWPGYCRASETMRGAMVDAIADEKRLLYPILQSIESRESEE